MRHWPWLGIACLSSPVWAQDPASALAARWNTICGTAVGGSALAARCGETFSSTAPNANAIAAEGQNLNQLPAEGRVSTAQEDAELERIELGQGWAFSINAQLGRTRRNDDAREAAFDGRSQSIQAGLDWTPHAKLTLGASLGAGRETLDFRSNRSFTESDGRQFALYLNWRVSERWSVDAYIDRSDGDSDARREISYTLPSAGGTVDVRGTSRSSSENRSEGFGASLAYSLPASGGWEHGFLLNADQHRTTLEAFDEISDSGLALSVPTRRITSRQNTFSYNATLTRSQEWGVWQPTFGLSWTQELANPARTLTVELVEDVADNPIPFQTAEPDKQWGGLSLGSNFVFGKGHSLYVQYSRRFGHSFLQSEVLALGWRVEL